MNKWTQFMDMHSGGGCKEPPYENIYIEATKDVSMVVFYNRFGHNPLRVTCTCCGEDYSITESISLEQSSGYERHCAYDKDGYKEEPSKWHNAVITMEEYSKQDNVLIIHASEIKDNERIGDIPTEGYIWV